MSRRQAPRGPLDRLADGIVAQRVGGASRVPAAAPVQAVNDAVAKAVKSAMSNSDRLSNIETFTLASNGAQTKTLAFLPITGSENVSLNGLAATQGVDWTRSDMTLSLLAPLDPLTSDVVEVQYDYYSALPATVPIGFAVPGTFVNAASTDGNGSGTLTGTMPTGIAAGDMLLAYTAGFAAATPTGWTLLTSISSCYAFWRLATGSDPAPSFSAAGTDIRISIEAFRGPTSLGTPVAAAGAPTGGTYACPTTSLVHAGSRIAILSAAEVSVLTTAAPGYPTGTTRRTNSGGLHWASGAGDAIESGTASTAWALTATADIVTVVVVELLP